MKNLGKLFKQILLNFFGLIKKVYSKIRGKEVKIINLDKEGKYKKIKIKKTRPIYKEIFAHQPLMRTAVAVFLLFIFLIFIYLFFGTWDIPRWLFGQTKFDFNYKEENYQK